LFISNRQKRKVCKDITEIYKYYNGRFLKKILPRLIQHFLEESLEKARLIIDEKLIWFAYFNDKPIAFFCPFS